MAEQPVGLLIDTDMGVDDAVAVGWLLAQTEYPVSIAGITTVAGNADVESVTRNVSGLLRAAGATGLPLVQGAAEPLQQRLSGTAAGVHGPDGLWFATEGLAPAPPLQGDAPEFLARHAGPNVTLVALGPLTNVATALRDYPGRMSNLKELVILGGARCAGNRTPVAEFNIWIDPEAAAIVFDSGLPISLIPLDAFAQFTLSPEDVGQITGSTNPIARFLSGPLERYRAIQTGLGEAGQVPDFVAIIYALAPSLGEAKSALVKVVPGIEEEGPARLLRGQTIIALTPDHKMALLAGDQELSALAQKMVSDSSVDLDTEIAAILARAENEVQVVTEIDFGKMRDSLLSALAG